MIDPRRPRRLHVDQPVIATRTGRASHLVVATVVDDFTWNCLTPEAQMVALTPSRWRDQLLAAQPDLLLVEPAWRGTHDAWRDAPLNRVPAPLLEIVDWCRRRDVPTVFWNKEDPVHFSTFLNTAAHFDVVATTDVDCVDRYRRALGHGRVHLVPFAAQPALHNPFESFHRIAGTAFAGAYYTTYPERGRDLDAIAPALVRQGPFHIYDRNFGSDEPSHRFPERYRPHIVGILSPREIDVAYKGYDLNLNLNSVKHSQTMFARRVFEVLASNTLVVSNYSRALRTLLGDLVVADDDGAAILDRLAEIDAAPGGRDVFRAAGVMAVLERHTYSNRLELLAGHAGLTLPAAAPTRPAVVARVADEAAASAVLESVARQRHPNLMTILLAEGRTPTAPSEVVGHPVLLAPDLAEVFRLARAGRATHLAEFRPTDWYGPRYVSELVLACRTVASGRAGYPVAPDQPAWTGTATIPLTRAAVAVSDWPALAEELAAAAGGATMSVARAAVWGAPDVVIDAGFDRARNAVTLHPVDDGAGRQAILDALAGGAAPRDAPQRAVPVPLFDRLLPREGVTVSAASEPAVESHLRTDEHVYVFSPAAVPLAELGLAPGFNRPVFECTGQRVSVQLVLMFHDDAAQRVGDVFLLPGDDTGFDVPAAARTVRYAVRVQGPGTAATLRYVAQPIPDPAAIVALDPTLLVSSTWLSPTGAATSPLSDFAVRRRQHLGRACALELAASGPARYRSFRGIDVAVAEWDAVEWMVRTGQVDEIVVAGSDRPAMSHLARGASGVRRCVVWIDDADAAIAPTELRDELSPVDAEVVLAFASAAVATRYLGGNQRLRTPASVCVYDSATCEIPLAAAGGATNG